MVAIPQPPPSTLDVCDALLEEVGQELPRPYLGMSSLGHECARKPWLSFRWVSIPRRPVSLIKAAQDGHRTEDLVIARLKLNPALTVEDRDPGTGEQWSFTDFGGHVRGHADGFITGLLEAPKARHTLEVKCSEKGMDAVNRLKAKMEEKAVLEAWDRTYFGQAQLYMFYSETKRHFCVVATPGGRDWTWIRTDYQPKVAEALRHRAERIIFGKIAPDRISEDPDHFLCKMCDHRASCHERAMPPRNCRTCAYVTPQPDGTWTCGQGEREQAPVVLPIEAQRRGCVEHRWDPSIFVWARAIEVVDGEVLYSVADGHEGRGFVDRGPDDE